MGVCGASEKEKEAARAEAEREKALAASEIQVHVEADDASVHDVTAYGIETAGEFLKRLTPSLTLPEPVWTELTLEFCDEAVPHECILQDAAIREASLSLTDGSVHVSNVWMAGSDRACAGCGAVKVCGREGWRVHEAQDRRGLRD